jgi:hypothetical protein
MLTLLLLAVTFHTDFEGASLGKIEKVSETHFRCAVKGEADQDGRNRQANWYYFRIDGAAGRNLTIDLVDLVGEYNYRAGTHAVTRHTRPVYSYDAAVWKHFDKAEWDDGTITLRLQFTPEKNRMFIAHLPPYNNQELESLLKSFHGHPHLKKTTVGKTVGGRDMLLLTVTNPKVPDQEKKVVWLMARQHSWEAGTSWVAEGALRFLLSSDAQAIRIRDDFVFKIFPLADPDGVARGGVRFNANGYDLNRNWDTVDPRRMPEIAAQRKAILDWVDSGRRIDFFLTLHNTESEDYVAGPLSAGGPGVLGLAERFSKRLNETTAFYSPKGPRDSGQTTTPAMKGRMMVTQALFYERQIPAFLMELMVEHSPKLRRPPTIEDRREFGAALVRIISTVVAAR